MIDRQQTYQRQKILERSSNRQQIYRQQYSQQIFQHQDQQFKSFAKIFIDDKERHTYLVNVEKNERYEYYNEKKSKQSTK